MAEPSTPQIFFAYPPVIAPTEAVAYTDAQIVEAMHYWVEQLGLRNWTIDFERNRGYDMGNALATLNMRFAMLRATVRLRAQDDNDPATDPMDDEQSLVHELVHLRLAGIHNRDWDDRPDSTEYKFCVEQPVERIALILVALRRAGAHEFSWET